MDFAEGVYLHLIEPPPPPYEPIPLHTVHVYTVYFFTQGRGEGVQMNQRNLEGNSSQSWVENTTMTDCISREI